MKLKAKKITKSTLSDKISDALTLKPRADIEDDHVFGTKPKIISRADLGSSDSEDEAAISDFRKRNVNLLSDVNKKYEGQVASRKDFEESGDESSSIDEQESLSNNVKQGMQDDSASDIEESEEELEGGNDIAATMDTDSDGNGSDRESDDYSITNFKKQLESDDESQNDGGDNVEDDDQEGYDISQMDDPVKEDFEHVKKQNLSEEAKKGICVRNQLLVWESLLEMRIHLQRCVNTANQMPDSETYNNLKCNEDFQAESENAKENIAKALEKLLVLQNLLLKNYPETKALSIKKDKQSNNKKQEQLLKPESDEEIPSDTDNEEIPSDTEEEDNAKETPKIVKESNKCTNVRKRKFEDYETELSSSYKAFKPFRDSSIEKWNDKTRMATAKNIKNAPTNTVLQQISYILSDREKLVKRTQLKRSDYEIVGYKKPLEESKNSDENNLVTKNRKDDDEYIPEIFDDSDFYHQLLRELIECKSANISDPVQLSRQWIALQQMRSKMKRKVDTKATKGRKIKYVVHNPLVNFMAPEKCMKWSEPKAQKIA